MCCSQSVGHQTVGVDVYFVCFCLFCFIFFFFFQAEDGIRDLVRSRGLGDVYKRQGYGYVRISTFQEDTGRSLVREVNALSKLQNGKLRGCLLYTSDAADERSSVDLGGRRIIKKKKKDG